MGKTTVAKEFSKTYKHKVFLNLEKNSDRSFFESTDDVLKIVETLFLSKNIPLKDISKNIVVYLRDSRISEGNSAFKIFL